eukprot:gnl/TRDRNA2_/TRDRNA2_177506_c0_seq39.p1 gnl/TRDRNA2_/TRDRNA2_177506_c0~~gnl/TRDRNA2_/TRDRNA2_177506_c0_seq39.p1  ORF type:complete len:242 (-),score=36.31 gnl/TRDRNA2_/TRDRNA2_177506_c0_seq39:393-1118(-)
MIDDAWNWMLRHKFTDQYDNLGDGKCRHDGKGLDTVVDLNGEIGACEQECNANSECTGYSVSLHNCLLSLVGPIDSVDDQGEGYRCYARKPVQSLVDLAAGYLTTILAEGSLEDARTGQLIDAAEEASCDACFPTACVLNDGTQKVCTKDNPYYDPDTDLCKSTCIEGMLVPQDASCDECFPTACVLEDGTQKTCTEDNPYYDPDTDLCTSSCGDSMPVAPEIEEADNTEQSSSADDDAPP